MNHPVTIHGGVRYGGKQPDSINLQLEELAADPKNPETSRVWLNTTNKKMKIVAGVKADGTPNVVAILDETDLTNFNTALAAKAGMLLSFYTGTLGPVSGTGSISWNAVAPLITEGTQIFSQAITPKGDGSRFVIDVVTMTDASVNNRNITLTLWRNNTFIGFATTNVANANRPQQINLHVVDVLPAGTGSVTYSVRCGSDGNGTWYLGRGYTATMGGNNRLSWTIAEVAA